MNKDALNYIAICISRVKLVLLREKIFPPTYQVNCKNIKIENNFSTKINISNNLKILLFFVQVCYPPFFNFCAYNMIINGLTGWIGVQIFREEMPPSTFVTLNVKVVYDNFLVKYCEMKQVKP